MDAVTLDAMRERLGLQLEIHESGWDEAELNNIASPAQDIRAIFDLMPTDTAQDWEHIAGRALNVPGAIDGYIESLRQARDAGTGFGRTPGQHRHRADHQVRRGGRLLRQAGRRRPDRGRPAAGAVQEKLDAGAAAARAPTPGSPSSSARNCCPRRRRRTPWGGNATPSPRAPSSAPRWTWRRPTPGACRNWTGSSPSRKPWPGTIQPGATIAEAKEILNNDPARQLKGTDALKAWMQELSDKAVAELAGVHFDIPDVMKNLECLIAPTDEGGIYYTGPSDDFSRPGRMWWSVPAGEDTFTTWAETTTVFHEGVPGHHLQIATATYRRELLNNWRRNVCWTSGHGEGWALYAEKLMQELGYLKDPGDHMGMLDMQRMRAARVVFDIGVHLELEMPERWGSGTWTPEKGYDFLKENLRHQRRSAQVRIHPLPRLAGPGPVLQGGPAALGADPRRTRSPARTSTSRRSTRRR